LVGNRIFKDWIERSRTLAGAGDFDAHIIADDQAHVDGRTESFGKDFQSNLAVRSHWNAETIFRKACRETTAHAERTDWQILHFSVYGLCQNLSARAQSDKRPRTAPVSFLRPRQNRSLTSLRRDVDARRR